MIMFYFARQFRRSLAKTLCMVAWVVGFVTLATPNVHAQNQLDGLGLGASPTATVAFSLRRLATAYSGPAVRVRRTSDNELRDVYFDATGAVSLNAPISAAGICHFVDIAQRIHLSQFFS